MWLPQAKSVENCVARYLLLHPVGVLVPSPVPGVGISLPLRDAIIGMVIGRSSTGNTADHIYVGIPSSRCYRLGAGQGPGCLCPGRGSFSLDLSGRVCILPRRRDSGSPEEVIDDIGSWSEAWAHDDAEKAVGLAGDVGK